MAEESSNIPGSGSPLLTQKEYADRKGWSKQYVNQLVKKGRIPLQNGRIDPGAADAVLAKSRDPAQNKTFKTPSMAAESLGSVADPHMTPDPQSSFSKVRTAREYYRALREQLEYEQLVGKLVPVSEVEEGAHLAALEFRKGFQVAATKMAETVAAKFHLEQHEVIDIVEAEINATLAELGRRFKEMCLEFEAAQTEDSED